jgi:hypothetical protein
MFPIHAFWAEDGWIYYAAEDESENADIWRLDPENSSTREKIGGTSDDDDFPIVCGNYIFFTCHTDSESDHEICRMNKDGTGLTEITSNNDEEYVYACGLNEQNILCQKDSEDGGDLYKMDYNGNNYMDLAGIEAAEFSADWGMVAVDDIDSSPSPEICNDYDVALSIEPSTTNPGDEVTLIGSATFPLVCVEMVDLGAGISGDTYNFRIEEDETYYYWKWDATINGTAGTYTAIFRANTQDSGEGVCPERAIGEWCRTSVEYNVEGPSPTPLPSPSSNDVQVCINGGGTWREDFSNTCVDTCEYARNPDMLCGQAITAGCDCGSNKCWNVEKLICESNNLSSPSPSIDCINDEDCGINAYCENGICKCDHYFDNCNQNSENWDDGCETDLRNYQRGENDG